jgi:UDP-N-acetylglucosamine 2-epimerase (non-hydrolysing)
MAASHPLLIVAGTRPECIKLAPVIRLLRERRGLRALVLNSGQHAPAVRRTFAEFGIECDLDLAPLPPATHLRGHFERLYAQLRKAIARTRPAMVVVQGDTLTTYAAARAAKALGRICAHLEAGLRTDTVRDPFPEEWFRRRVARFADLHFAPTARAARNLAAEGIDPASIHLVGNTGIDALLEVMQRVSPRKCPSPEILVTLHRRENWDSNIDIVCHALKQLAECRPALRVTFPVHPNPRVAQRIHRELGGHPAFELVEPMGYESFVRRVAAAALVVSDSGGVQEEAPHLGTRVVVPRANTERPEAIETGFVELVDVMRESLLVRALAALDAPPRAPVPIDARAPFGDGRAAHRVVPLIEAALAERAYA